MYRWHEACLPVKIHKLASSLIKPQGSKRVEKSTHLWSGNYRKVNSILEGSVAVFQSLNLDKTASFKARFTSAKRNVKNKNTTLQKFSPQKTEFLHQFKCHFYFCVVTSFFCIFVPKQEHHQLSPDIYFWRFILTHKGRTMVEHSAAIAQPIHQSLFI